MTKKNPKIFPQRPIYLCPITEDLAIAAIGHQFFRVLGNGRVEVVHYHEHHRGCLLGATGVAINGMRSVEK